VAETLAAAVRRVVVLDDDPTGTQAATDVTVLLDVDPHALAGVLRSERSVYLQTNSRALSEADALVLARDIRDAVGEAAHLLGVEIDIVLRGDSTLRGHVFSESRVFMDDDSVLLFVPAFPEGGRVTRGGLHLVIGPTEVPVGETEFAHDPVFGFRSSRLADFVRERTGVEAISLTLDEVRTGGIRPVLLAAAAGSIVVADAENADDIRALAAAVRDTWRDRAVVVRAAASLAAELAGVASSAPAPPDALRTDGPLLVVCGSHTELARAQVAALVDLVGPPTQIDTLRALDDPEMEGRRAAAEEAARIRSRAVRFLTTERDRSPEHGTLAHGAAVMRALAEAARVLAASSTVVVTKGGITAAEVIRTSLGARTARVLGQVEPGVSIVDAETRSGLVRCLVVPGNMGGTSILADAVRWAEGQ
jgi:uncharacterized protein YgbK (DUF1537 family)